MLVTGQHSLYVLWRLVCLVEIRISGMEWVFNRVAVMMKERKTRDHMRGEIPLRASISLPQPEMVMGLRFSKGLWFHLSSYLFSFPLFYCGNSPLKFHFIPEWGPRVLNEKYYFLPLKFHFISEWSPRVLNEKYYFCDRCYTLVDLLCLLGKWKNKRTCSGLQCKTK